MVEDTYTSGMRSEWRHVYFSAASQVLEERIDPAATADVQYVWGIRHIDELVCRDDAAPRRLYAPRDANFNVTALATTAGAVAQRFVYDPYGAD